MKALCLLAIFAAAPLVHASTLCPTTANTLTDCNYVITIGASGTASVMDVAGSAPFNGPVTFTDGTSDPGGDGSLVGVVNDSSTALQSLTLEGSGSSAGIFDFSFNGICVYTSAPYCGAAASGYEGPTTTFSNLMSTVLFETNVGTVNFSPGLAAGANTYFSIEGSPADLNANGGLKVLSVTEAPEPSEITLVTIGGVMLLLVRRRMRSKLPA